MADIFHNLIIKAPTDKVFAGVSTSDGLDIWWTKTSEGDPAIGAAYILNFGPQYIWKAIVTKCEVNGSFELQITDADPDWVGTKVGFILQPKDNTTYLNFYHTGWPENNEHFKFSSFCWAMYLRILQRNIEFGEEVPFEKRLSV